MNEKPRIKKTFDWVQREPLIKPWHRKLSSGSERTAIHYAYNLQRLLEERKQTPEQFLEYCKSKYTSPKATGELWVELRDQAYEFKPSQVKMIVKAFRSFLTHHGVFLPAERLPTPKPNNKKELPYDELKKIVALCPEPYRTIFTIFTYAPMGEVSFIQWNNSDDMAQDVQRQLSNRKDYVKVVHPPRKNARFRFYSLIPKTVIQDYLDRGGILPFRNSRGYLVKDYNLQKEWRSIRENRAGYKKHKGVGVHEIRDAWFTWAGTPSGGRLDWDYRKFAIGHSQFSEQEYNKLWEREGEMADQLRGAWAARDSDPELAKKITEIEESTKAYLYLV